MSIERVRSRFRRLGIEQRILEFPVSSATVELAAQAVGTEAARIAKTLSFQMDGRVALVVTAGDARIDNRKFKDAFRCKPRMLPAGDVERLVGHAVGGVCPFAVNAGCDVYLDESLRRFATVFPACGSANSAIELTPEELERYAAPCSWIDVCKLPM